VSSPGWKVLREHPNRISVDVLNASMKCADAVTVSTDALAAHYSRFQPNIHVLPNYLDWEMWERVEQQSEVERPKLRVGWMGWLAWRDNDLDILRDVLPAFLRRHHDVEFVSVGEPRGAAAFKPGHVSVHDYLGIPKAQRRTVHGVPYRRLPEIVPTIDIGLVPLARSAFNECKSYLKGLEYAACGIPCIATPTGPYRGFVRDGEDGLLASTAEEWLAALELLVGDDALRRRMGRAARAKAETMTIQREAWRWEQLYRSLVSSPSEPSTAFTTATSGSSNAAPVLAG
jgi:glycosyltransferase involved in cell wall biosynthesis